MEVDSHQLAREIGDAEQDIRSLQQEIGTLQHELLLVNGTVSSLEKDIERERLEIKHIKDRETTNKNTSYDESDPPIVQHSYFDDSIGHYFKTGEDFTPRVKKIDLNDLALGISQSSKKLIGLRENILYENLYRLGGITAFPLNTPDLLGLRFDAVGPSGVENSAAKFQKPHYVILRKQISMHKSGNSGFRWIVYKHTLLNSTVNNIVAEVDAAGFETDDDIDLFAKKVYRAIQLGIIIERVVTSAYSIKFRDIVTTWDRTGQPFVFKKIDSDRLTRITFSFNAREDGLSLLTLILDGPTVSEVKADGSSFDEERRNALHIVNMRLRGNSITDLDTRLQYWLQGAIEKRLI